MSGLRRHQARHSTNPADSGRSPVARMVFISSSRAKRSGMAIGRVRPISPPQSWATRVMPAQIEPVDEGEDRAAVEVEGVDRLVHRLVRAPEAVEVGRHRAMTGGGEDRDHLAVEVAPGGLAVQAEEDLGGVGRSLVEVVQPRALEAVEILEIVGLEVVARQVGEAFVRGAQRFGHRRDLARLARGVAAGPRRLVSALSITKWPRALCGERRHRRSAAGRAGESGDSGVRLGDGRARASAPRRHRGPARRPVRRQDQHHLHPLADRRHADRHRAAERVATGAAVCRRAARAAGRRHPPSRRSRRQPGARLAADRRWRSWPRARASARWPTAFRCSSTGG